MTERIYSPDEVAAIIERTAEHQRRAPEAGRPDGLTLAEIERACQAAGIDPGFVRHAASEVEAGAGSLALEAGAGATSVAEHWADGPATAEGWEDAVDHLRVRFGQSMAFGATDGARSVGAGWEWTHQSMGGLRRTVSVSPREGRTRVRVVTVDAGFEDPRVMGAAIGALVGAVSGMLIGALLAETLGYGDLVGVLAVVLTLLAAVMAGAAGLSPWIRRGREQQARDARALAEEVAQWVSAPASATSEGFPVAAAAAPPEPRLTLDLDAPPDPEGPAASSRRTRA